jgi:hypothetical protein
LPGTIRNNSGIAKGNVSLESNDVKVQRKAGIQKALQVFQFHFIRLIKKYNPLIVAKYPLKVARVELGNTHWEVGTEWMG